MRVALNDLATIRLEVLLCSVVEPVAGADPVAPLFDDALDAGAAEGVGVVVVAGVAEGVGEVEVGSFDCNSSISIPGTTVGVALFPLR